MCAFLQLLETRRRFLLPTSESLQTLRLRLVWLLCDEEAAVAHKYKVKPTETQKTQILGQKESM